MSDFAARLIQFQSDLAVYLDTDQLPERIMEMTRDLMSADNCLIAGKDGSVLGNWWVRNTGWKVKQYSMQVIEKAIESDVGYWRGGVESNDPTESQIKGNILSCLAARVNAGKKTIGALYCDVRAGGKRYTDADCLKLKQIADCFAVYLAYCEGGQQTKTEPEASSNFVAEGFVAENAVLKELMHDIESTARMLTPVLITGESGVGKEVVARMLHDFSEYRKGEFVIVHCAAITRELFESELFGHEKGAFSGAFRKRQGLILKSDGGTLFLDEVGDIPLEVQVKLLRVLEAKMVRAVGSDVEIGPVNFRLISATNRNLEKMVAEKTFREDLYYRIRGRLLRIPALRDRPEDIPLLASHFASPKRIDPEAMTILTSLKWPGNVRELKAIVSNARSAARGYEITRDIIQKELQFQPTSTPEPPADGFYEVKMHWQKGDLSADQLQQIVESRYRQAGENWNEMARQWGLLSSEEVKAFRNWIYYLQKNRKIRVP